MSQQIPGQAPENDWPENDWPEYEEPPWPVPPEPDTGRRTGRRWVLATVAVAAAALGVAGTLIVTGLRDAASPGTAEPSPAATTAGPDTVVPPPGAGPTAGRTLVMSGAVQAVSATSITLAGPSGNIRASITDATRFSGRVQGAGGIKVGDTILAQLAQNGSRLVATAIQDPA